MMEFKVFLESVIQSIEFSIRFILCWLSLLNAVTDDNLIHRETSSMITFCSSARGFMQSFNNAYHAQSDAVKLTKILFKIGSVAIQLIKMIIFICKRSRSRISIVEVMKFLGKASFYGTEILKRYENGFSPLYSFFETSAALFIEVTTVNCELMFLVQHLPSNVHYFSGWDASPAIQTILHVLKVCATFVSTKEAFVDLEIYELSWFVHIRFDLFAVEFMIATIFCEFDNCIEKLQKFSPPSILESGSIESTMRWTITPEAAVFAVKFAFYPMICWPLPKNASGKHVIFQNIAWCVAVLIPGHGIPISIIYMASVRHDPARLTKALVEWGAGVGTVSKMIMLKVHQSRLQVAIANLEEFIKTAGRREREFMNRCIRKCGKFYLTVEVLTCIGASAFAASPLVLAQPVPGQIDYPFEWKNSTKLIAVIYCSQVFVLLQVTAGVTLDIQFALLLWHAGIRFELLAERFKNARRPREFDECAQEHQELIAYTTDITDAVRYYVINVLFTTSLVSISAGYQFVSHQPIEDVIQYSVLLLVACLQVAVYAWPADNLSNVSEGIAYAVYSSPWVGVSREWTSSIQLVMIRSQKPIIIATNGLFPILNLDFYGQFLVRTFSYFTTLRAVIG